MGLLTALCNMTTTCHTCRYIFNLGALFVPSSIATYILWADGIALSLSSSTFWLAALRKPINLRAGTVCGLADNSVATFIFFLSPSLYRSLAPSIFCKHNILAGCLVWTLNNSRIHIVFVCVYETYRKCLMSWTSTCEFLDEGLINFTSCNYFSHFKNNSFGCAIHFFSSTACRFFFLSLVWYMHHFPFIVLPFFGNCTVLECIKQMWFLRYRAHQMLQNIILHNLFQPDTLPGRFYVGWK